MGRKISYTTKDVPLYVGKEILEQKFKRVVSDDTKYDEKGSKLNLDIWKIMRKSFFKLV